MTAQTPQHQLNDPGKVSGPKPSNNEEAVEEGLIKDPTSPSLINAPNQEWTRIALAGTFSVSYILVILFLVYHVISSEADSQKLSIITSTLLAPLGTLVGSIVGFLFWFK